MDAAVPMPVMPNGGSATDPTGGRMFLRGTTLPDGRRADALLVSDQARVVLDLPPVGLRPGDPTGLLAIRAADLDEAAAGATEDRAVFHRSRLVARAQVTTALHHY